jgi:type IV secretory pathway VirJ component
MLPEAFVKAARGAVSWPGAVRRTGAALFAAAALAGPAGVAAPDAGAPAAQDAAPPVAGTPRAGRPAPAAVTLRLRMGVKSQIFVYAPPAPPKPGARAVIFFSGHWGWRPLQQDTAAHIAAAGRWLVGIDSSEYFSRRLENVDWARDLATLRAFANDKAGLPAATPVLLIGFTWGADLTPYMLNHGGADGFAGALLIGPGNLGSFIYRVTLEMKGVPWPPDETFDVGEEMRRMAPIPVVLMEGALDADSRARDYAASVRGPHTLVSVPGADKQFRDVRDIYLGFVDQSLAWLEDPRRGTTIPGPAAPGDQHTP